MRGLSDERAEKALRFLADTDEECAALRAETERAEFKAKAVRDAVLKRAEGTVADRTAFAGSCDEYRAAMDDYFDVLRRYEAMRNKRGTEAIVVDVWRSANANRRMGNV